jgi:hypothetical protein
MENRGPNEAHRPFHISRKSVTLRGRAVEGDDQAIVETIDTTDVSEQGSEQTSVTRFSYCGGCNRAIKGAEQVAGRCAVCGAVLCPNCVNVVCADEQCQKTVCPSCRELWGGLVYCKPHARSEFIKRFLGCSILAVFVGIAIFLLLRLVS